MGAWPGQRGWSCVPSYRRPAARPQESPGGVVQCPRPGKEASMFTILAVYENGVLRPTTPLALREGQTVQLAVNLPPLFLIPPDATPEDRDFRRRLLEAKTPEEVEALIATLPPDDVPEDYDIVKAINENRRRWGFRLPDPEPGEDVR